MLIMAVSCGRSEKKDNTKYKVSTTNAKLEKMEKIEEELFKDHNVDITTLNPKTKELSQTNAISSFSHKKCTEIKDLLASYIRLGDQVESLTNDKNIIFTEKYQTKIYVDNAKNLNSKTSCITLEAEQKEAKRLASIEKQENQFNLAQSNLLNKGDVEFFIAGPYDLSDDEVIRTSQKTVQHDEAITIISSLSEFLEKTKDLEFSSLDKELQVEKKRQIAQEKIDRLSKKLPVLHIQKLSNDLADATKLLNSDMAKVVTAEEIKLLISKADALEVMNEQKPALISPEDALANKVIIEEIRNIATARLNVENTEDRVSVIESESL